MVVRDVDTKLAGTVDRMSAAKSIKPATRFTSLPTRPLSKLNSKAQIGPPLNWSYSLRQVNLRGIQANVVAFEGSTNRFELCEGFAGDCKC